VANISPITLAHEPDIAWIIALWLWIHDGDPAPVEVALNSRTAVLADEFAGYLAKTMKSERTIPTVEALQQRLQQLKLPLEVTEAKVDARPTEELHVLPRPSSGNEPPGCCVRLGNRMICVRLTA
jgi:hypothetical protein